MLAHFENGEKCDGSKTWASVHMMPEQFENVRKLDGKNSLQDFDAKEVYLHPKNRYVSFQKRLKMFCFHHFQVFTRCRFQNVPVRVPFSKSTIFRICRQKLCSFRVNGRPIRRVFHHLIPWSVWWLMLIKSLNFLGVWKINDNHCLSKLAQIV